MIVISQDLELMQSNATDANQDITLSFSVVKMILPTRPKRF